MPRFPNQEREISASTAESACVDGDRLPGRSGRLVARDVLLVAQRDADVVETLQQPPTRVVVDVEGVLDAVVALTGTDRAGLEIDGDGGAGVCLEQVPEP